MNIKQRPFLIMAVFTTLLLGSCQDWGQTDPPSGNQIYPKLEKLATFSFEEDIDPAAFQLFEYPDGSKPTIVDDSDQGSKVLHLNGGYARIDNPVNAVKVQNGVSLTFWIKPVSGDEGTIFSFCNENESQKMFFTANGWFSYDAIDGKYEDNNPDGLKVELMTADQWHYVAIAVRNDGYAVYVDGMRKIDRTVSNFDFSKIVQFIASVPYLHLGYGSDADPQEWMIDDLTVYRNQITDKQIEVPGTGGGEEQDKYIIVGQEDMSTAWWTEFSDLVTMAGEQTSHFGFYNYTNGSANWKNWAVVLTNGKNRDETGYAEYFVLRADAWENLSSSNTNITSNYNWDTFTTDMKGAYVDLTIKRTANRIDLTAVTTTVGGTVYTMTYFYEGTLASTIGTLLTCEGAYLAIDPETVYVGDSYEANTYRVGPSDNSAGWWTSFSNLSKITGSTYPFAYTFYNYTNGSTNWNNWILVVTNGKDRGEEGYAEYFVLRSDAFGWGDANYNGGNISHGYDFDKFTTQMNGASCMIRLTRDGNRLDMIARVTTAAGEELGDYTFFYEGISTTDIGAFLTVEGASLDIRSVAFYPFLNAVK